MRPLHALGSLVVLVSSLAVAAPAKPKAHMECMSGMPIKAGKAAKLTAELWCTIRVDKLGGFKTDGLVATLTPRFGKASTLKTEPGGIEVKVIDTQDGTEARLDNAWVIDKDYKACEPFEVVGSLHDAVNRGMDDEVWTQTFKIAASCPKPKPVKGVLTCHAKAQDGTTFSWPGNGAKLKPRLESTLSCSITAGKGESGVTYEVSLAVAKKGTPTTGPFQKDEAQDLFFEAQFEEATYEACSNFDVVGEVRASGAKLWSGKLAIKQDCPD